MGFSAGVMLGVSIFELLPEAIEGLGILLSGIFFLLGMVTVAMIDFIIPHEYLLEYTGGEVKSQDLDDKNQLMRTGKLVALGIAIHNFPEGLVTMSGTLHSIQLGFLLALAIFFHNIPEGLSVAIPIYAASNDMKRAFNLTFLSGLAEPLGAIFGLIFMIGLGMITTDFIEISLAFVAGVMIFISIDEILPYAYKANSSIDGNPSHIVSGGILLGISIILTTLVILG
jgi:ZIP family zinc transporter